MTALAYSFLLTFSTFHLVQVRVAPSPSSNWPHYLRFHATLTLIVVLANSKIRYDVIGVRMTSRYASRDRHFHLVI